MNFSILDPVYKKSETVIKWLKEPGGPEYQEFLRDWRTQKERILRTSREPVEIARAQGSLEILDRLIQLREELQQRGNVGQISN